MKKKVLIFAAFICFGISVNAQTLQRWSGCTDGGENRIELYKDGFCSFKWNDGTWSNGSYTIEKQDEDYILIIHFKDYNDDLRGDVSFKSDGTIYRITTRSGAKFYKFNCS